MDSERERAKVAWEKVIEASMAVTHMTRKEVEVLLQKRFDLSDELIKQMREGESMNENDEPDTLLSVLKDARLRIATLPMLEPNHHRRCREVVGVLDKLIASLQPKE